MQLHNYLLPLLATASTISAQAMLNWAFYQPGSECNQNWHDEPSNEAYWTKPEGRCIPMNTHSGEYDVIIGATNVGLNAVNPAMYACPNEQCDLEDCILMAKQGWGGQGMGCQHMHSSPYWWINGVSIPMKREVERNETEVATDRVGLGPRDETKSENEPRLRAIEFEA